MNIFHLELLSFSMTLPCKAVWVNDGHLKYTRTYASINILYIYIDKHKFTFLYIYANIYTCSHVYQYAYTVYKKCILYIHTVHIQIYTYIYIYLILRIKSSLSGSLEPKEYFPDVSSLILLPKERHCKQFLINNKQ